MMQLTATNRDALAARGYALTAIGFDDQWVALYTHKPLVDKVPGDVAFKARVSNPKMLNSGEAYYLARKARQGFFPWKPDECLSHKFTNVEYVKDKLGGTRVVRHDPTMGCEWCRKAAPATSRPEPEPVPAAAAPAAEPPAVPTCDECGWKSLKGNYLPQHKRSRHKRTVPAPAETPPVNPGGSA